MAVIRNMGSMSIPFHAKPAPKKKRKVTSRKRGR